MAYFDYEKMRKLRKKNNWSTRELGEKLLVSKATISRYETGEREPSLEAIEKIALLFNLETADLIQNQTSLTEKYLLTLRKEVLKEYAARISANLMKLLMREKITEDTHPLTIYLLNLTTVQNKKILHAKDMDELNKLEGFLNESENYVATLVKSYTDGNVA